MFRIALVGLAVLVLFGLPISDAVAQTQSGPAPSAAAPGTDKKSINKDLADEADKLKVETEGRLKKLDELEIELKKNQHDTEFAGKTVDDLLALLRDSAARLAPESAFRKMLSAQVATARDLANQTAANQNPKIRELSKQYNDRADEMAAMGREAEQLRTGLLAQIGRLEEKKEELKFITSLAGIEEFVKNSRAYLDQLKSVANGSKSLADKLDNAFGSNRPSQ
jgi:hypothetical protein